MVCEDKSLLVNIVVLGFLLKSTMYRHIKKYYKIKKNKMILKRRYI